MNSLQRILHSLFLVNDTPRRTALAFSLGVFLSFSPLLGLHTLLGLLLAFLFRLNRVAVLIGVWTNTPWIVVPFYGFATWLGLQLIGFPERIALPEVGFVDLLKAEFWQWLFSQWRLLVPVFVGSFVLCTTLASLTYPVALSVLRRYERHFAVERSEKNITVPRQ